MATPLNIRDMPKLPVHAADAAHGYRTVCGIDWRTTSSVKATGERHSVTCDDCLALLAL